MAKVKMSKKSTSIDMTAMCDVAFLLLTFFILTATAKTPEPLPVETPNSTVQTKLPETGLVTITIGKSDGKNQVFFGMKDRDVRVGALEYMSEKYGVTFTDKQKAQFELVEEFGVPIEQLGSILDMKAADRAKVGVQSGIPLDSIGENKQQLQDWIQYARKANIDRGATKELDFAIKGDAKEEYPQIKQIMDILQNQKINNFNLVTGLRGKDY
ncbi:MAG TPA: biopolymer transporter ExbD [Flavobacterium sp.]|jgi:biopolymer transport protein ExbD|uniref:ExbD/TolR family protein n=1 Tax=Flavobacterium sp. TaxID=239 RepID=UPI002C8EB099|nr:biopolymer transporter ExbD [Flavobacterium sp.]MCA0349916.1 biopolymer transporter ExbD [Bacteroidota bacterium]HPW98380.1 biopolymer transporter ExbD [Flavobacterium sp.]HQA73981.1 biopolymer transporter ExbD [Flavobacterium sp.]